MCKYTENINTNKTHLYFGSKCSLNEDDKCVIFKDIKELTFTREYLINLIEYFIKIDYKPISELLSDEIIENIKKYNRREINGKELKYYDQFQICLSSVNQYLSQYFNDMISLNKENIVYIDTNSIFYINDIDIIDIPIPFEIKYYKYGFFVSKQKYVLVNDEYSIIKKGFLRSHIDKEILPLVEKVERIKKLNNILYER